MGLGRADSAYLTRPFVDTGRLVVICRKLPSDWVTVDCGITFLLFWNAGSIKCVWGGAFMKYLHWKCVNEFALFMMRLYRNPSLFCGSVVQLSNHYVRVLFWPFFPKDSSRAKTFSLFKSILCWTFFIPGWGWLGNPQFSKQYNQCVVYPSQIVVPRGKHTFGCN